MNCKQGDLAVFVRSKAGNEGKIVQCLRLATLEELTHHNHVHFEGPVWVIDRPLPRERTPAALALDSFLRPINNPGDDKVDEMLLITGKPNEVTA